MDGLIDVVVAACPDGILVCAKKETEDIKKSVENLTPRPMYEERRWGTYRVLDDTVHIPVGHHHAIKALTELTFIEVQCGNPLIEEDIERFPYNWKE